MELTHFDDKGNARMVDVTEKEDTVRQAVAKGKIKVSQAVFDGTVELLGMKGE